MKRYVFTLTPFVAFLIVSLLLGLLSACGNAFQTLQDIVAATEAAVPILQAAGVNIPPQVNTYVGDVAACVAGTDGAQPTATELLQISSCLAGLVAPQLPPGVAQAVVTIIGQVIQDVSTYLSQHPAGPAVKTLSASQQSAFQALRTRARLVRDEMRRH